MAALRARRHFRATARNKRWLLLLALGVAGPAYPRSSGAVPAAAATGAAARRGKASPARHPKRPDDTAHSEPCRKLPAGKRIVKLNLKPETNVADLIAWISSITCAQVIVANPVTAADKKVTIFAPEPITPEEAYRLFLDALDSVGLTVVRSGPALEIIETAKAKSAPIPFYGWEDQPK